jgi:hypothetical protein
LENFSREKHASVVIFLASAQETRQPETIHPHPIQTTIVSGAGCTEFAGLTRAVRLATFVSARM